jgi:hypothetical protein
VGEYVVAGLCFGSPDLRLQCAGRGFCLPLRLRRVWRLISRRERRGGTAEGAGLEQRIGCRAETRGERRDTDTRLLAPSAPTVLAWMIAPARPPARHVCLQRMRRGRPRCSRAPETSSVVSNKHDAGAATKDPNRGEHSHGKAAPSVSAVTPVSPREKKKSARPRPSVTSANQADLFSELCRISRRPPREITR